MRYRFFLKSVIVLFLIVVFDRLVQLNLTGVGAGVFAAVWAIGVIVGRSDMRRNRLALVAIGASIVFAASLFFDVGILAWILFWCALSLAVLLPKVVGFDDAWRWSTRLMAHAILGIAKPFNDWTKVSRRRARGHSLRVLATALALPLIGGTLFLILFAAANPLIERALTSIRLPSVWDVLMWLVAGLCIWPSLRPHPAVLRVAAKLPGAESSPPTASLASVLIALAVFNVIFAVQNMLDIAILWNGGSLPAGMTQTEYVHRGAYPLIATALIAGGLALAMLSPGSASERHPWARRLMTLWVLQNLILVASSALRTIDYVEASMLTAWRIAALAWMALVALGLILICWRILTGRSARWLINWNASAALAVLTACTFLDLGAIAADWNVRAQRPERVDLCYLHQVGDGAILPLIALEGRPMDAATRHRVRTVREHLLNDLYARQDAWNYWTPRGAMRLSEAQARLRRLPNYPAAPGAADVPGCRIED